MFLFLKEKKRKETGKANIKQDLTHAILNLEYTLIRDHHKTIRLRVKADASVEVKAPHRCKQNFIDSFLEKRSDWIMEKRQNVLDFGAKPQISFEHKASFYCLGQEFRFHYQQNPQIQESASLLPPQQSYADYFSQKHTQSDYLDPVSLYSLFLKIGHSSHKSCRICLAESTDDSTPHATSLQKNTPVLLIQTQAENSQKQIESWRKKSAEPFLQACLDQVWHGLTHKLASENTPCSQADRELVQNLFLKQQKPGLRVRSLTKRFGSYSTKGEVCLARQLLSYPIELIEYVIVHECCHIIFMNHSKNFYNLLTACCSNAKQKKEKLHEWYQKHPHF